MDTMADLAGERPRRAVAAYATLTAHCRSAGCSSSSSLEVEGPRGRFLPMGDEEAAALPAVTTSK